MKDVLKLCKFVSRQYAQDAAGRGLKMVLLKANQVISTNDEKGEDQWNRHYPLKNWPRKGWIH